MFIIDLIIIIVIIITLITIIIIITLTLCIQRSSNPNEIELFTIDEHIID